MSSREPLLPNKPAPPLLRRSQGLLTRAAALNSASAEVDRTFADRSSSPEAYRAWHEAAAEFHAAREEMYPESFWRDTRALAASETKAIEPALEFLESDPWCFRSGYVKAELMRYLSRVPLIDRQQERTQRILLHLVEVGDRREFGYACRLARALDSAGLHADLKRLLTSSNRSTRRRALQMIVSLPELPLDSQERQAAIELVTEEGRIQWRALAHDADGPGDVPGTWNIHRQNWVRRVAGPLGLDPYSFADPES